MSKVKYKRRESNHSVIESYRALCTNLQFCGKDKKVIGITSATPDEGKSTVTQNIAITLASLGHKVILVDADLRRSVVLGKLVHTEEIKGVSHCLSGQAELNEIIYDTNLDNMDLIVAGPVPPNPTELLGGARFKEMIRRLREEYDYVLVDTPPIGSVIDGVIISKVCDGMVIVIESGKISYRFAQDVKRQLEVSGCPILGTVLNKVETKGNSYYGKYGKYGKYGVYGDY